VGPLVVLAATATLSALATRPAHAFRPFVGTDAHVAEPHLLEIEVGPLGYLRRGSERFLIAPEAVVNYGTGSGFEFVLEGRGLMQIDTGSVETPVGLDDFALSAKKVLRRGVLQGREGPSVATEAELQLPSKGAPGTGISAALILSQRWRSMGMHVNVAVERTREHEPSLLVSVIGEGPERWPVRPAVEVSLERAGEESPVRGLLLGAIWQTRQGLTMDAAVRTASGDEHEFELRSGFTWKMQFRPPR
jgi:hypothetical protein